MICVGSLSLETPGELQGTARISVNLLRSYESLAPGETEVTFEALYTSSARQMLTNGQCFGNIKNHLLIEYFRALSITGIA